MGGMKDLFGDTPYQENNPSTLTRRTDPSTSREAAEKIVTKLRPLQQQVYAVMKAAGPEGLTDLDLESKCGSHGSTYRTRRSELTGKGLIVDTGRKRLQRGSYRIIWAIK
jgi:hypothetical protein